MLRDLASGSLSGGVSALVVVIVIVLVVLVISVRFSSPPATPSWAKPKSITSSQLRHDANARFIRDRGFLFRSRVWFVGTGCPPIRIGVDRHQAMASRQGSAPQMLARSDQRSWWWFDDVFYWDSASYSPQDVLALVRDRQRKEQQKLQRAHMMLNAEQNAVGNRRQPIPRDLRRLVFERDGGQCVECGSNFDLQYDHVIPVALGGATSYDNLQLLCGPCNREKSANI